ncbi:uncharacterized protein LOC111578494 [Amphiprion ocellaris]|uniref:uncharacterized protein LOC111578494 n=1 Tax=Amphiprion ocellaris TaxID=80972 RepID=UPI0024110FFD|nr:uncharacterized protein LOC111578494 [Amphiprion ocellaris]
MTRGCAIKLGKGYSPFSCCNVRGTPRFPFASLPVCFTSCLSLLTGLALGSHVIVEHAEAGIETLSRTTSASNARHCVEQSGSSVTSLIVCPFFKAVFISSGYRGCLFLYGHCWVSIARELSRSLAAACPVRAVSRSRAVTGCYRGCRLLPVPLWWTKFTDWRAAACLELCWLHGVPNKLWASGGGNWCLRVVGTPSCVACCSSPEQTRESSLAKTFYHRLKNYRLFTTCSNSWYRTSPHGSRRFPSHFYSEDHLLLLKLLTNVSAALKSGLQNFLKTLKVSSAAGCFVELFQKTSLNHMEGPQDSRLNETIQKPN